MSLFLFITVENGTPPIMFRIDWSDFISILFPSFALIAHNWSTPTRTRQVQSKSGNVSIDKLAKISMLSSFFTAFLTLWTSSIFLSQVRLCSWGVDFVSQRHESIFHKRNFCFRHTRESKARTKIHFRPNLKLSIIKYFTYAQRMESATNEVRWGAINFENEYPVTTTL